MGEVYRAQKVGGVPVAVKLIRPDLLHQTDVRRRFAREARAAARLDHPNLCRILDYGTDRGQTYLTMELVEGTSLDRWRDAPPDADSILQGIDGVLAALAHAHARGVIHGDLKPENIMVSWGRDGRPRMKVMDFGVARFRDETEQDGASSFVGTPAYMTPEQAARLDDVTPVTDLYAVGVMLFELITGRLPYDAKSPAGMLFAHLRDPIPALIPRSGWKADESLAMLVRRLLAKDPLDRFAFAADVREALTRCTLRGTGVAPRGVEPDAGDASLLGTVVRSPERPSRTRLVTHPREDASSTTTTPLTHADEGGFSLFSIRELPLRGRDAELGTLRSHAASVAGQHRLRAVVVRGEQGLGKTRLVTALREELDEQGAMQIWWARETSDPFGALREAVERGFGLRGRPPVEARARLASLLQRQRVQDEWEVQALTEFVGLDADRKAPRRLADDNARFAVFDRALARAARQRPVLLLLEDLHHGDGTPARLLRFLLEGQSARLPVLVVLTIRPEAQAGAGDAHLALQQTLEYAGPLIDDVRLRALDLRTTQQLVRATVPMAPEVADAVAMRAGGNPQLATELVRQLVDSGRLEGLGERPDPIEVLRELTEGIAGLLERRLVEAAAAPGADALTLFVWEHLAVLGLRVPVAPALEILRLAGVPGPARVLDRALTVGVTTGVLVEERPDLFRFDNTMLRDALLARDVDRRPARERLAAEARLAAGTPEQVAAQSAEIAEHYFAAHDPQAALPHLMARAARASREQVLRAAIPTWERALAVARACHNPTAELEVLMGLAEAQLDAAAHEPARAAALAARRLAVQEGLPVPPAAARVMADAARKLGSLQEARTLYQIALSELEASGDKRGAAPAETGLAQVELRDGRVQEAERLLRAARTKLLAADDQIGVAAVDTALAQAALATGLFEEAMHMTQTASQRYATLQHRRGVALCMRLQGEIAAAQSDWGTAVDTFDRAREELLAVGDVWGAALALLYRALAAERQDRTESALAGYEESRRVLTALGDHASAAIAQLAAARVHADAGAWELAIPALTRVLEVDDVASIDDARFVDLLVDAARTCIFAEQTPLAGELLQRADRKLQRIADGSPVWDRADEVQYLLHELGMTAQATASGLRRREENSQTRIEVSDANLEAAGVVRAGSMRLTASGLSLPELASDDET